MTQDKSTEAREGLVDTFAGKAKEVAGAVSGKDDLVEEGQLQQAEARNRKEAAAYDAIADAERSQAAQELRESSREAQSQKQAAEAAAAEGESEVRRQHDAEYAAADRTADLHQLHGDEVATAHGDQVAEDGLREAAAIAEEAEATEQQAQQEKSRLEREAANAEQDAARLRTQVHK
jgi:uncharacterized protein YjbJ (UPF0337 family)